MKKTVTIRQDLVDIMKRNVEAIKRNFRMHKKREYDSLKMKWEDKERARKDTSFLSISFDLQAVLQISYAAANQITIFDLFDKRGHYFL